MRTALWVLMVALVLPTLTAASTDGFIGKWVLDPEQSRYPAGTCPKRMIIEMEPVARGIHYRSDTTYRNGRTAHAEYTADYSGRQVLVWGNYGLLLPVSLQRIDSRTVIASYFQSFQLVAISRRVVSRDGRRMTITTTSKPRSGRSVETIGVYRKQMEEPEERTDAAQNPGSQSGPSVTESQAAPDYTREFIPQQEPRDHLVEISRGRLALCFEIPTVLTVLSIAIGALVHKNQSQTRD